MDVIEFDNPYYSSIEEPPGGRIEPNEPVWRLALSPTSVMAMDLPTGMLDLVPFDASMAADEDAEDLKPTSELQGTSSAPVEPAVPHKEDAPRSGYEWPENEPDAGDFAKRQAPSDEPFHNGPHNGSELEQERAVDVPPPKQGSSGPGIG